MRLSEQPLWRCWRRIASPAPPRRMCRAACRREAGAAAARARRARGRLGGAGARRRRRCGAAGAQRRRGRVGRCARGARARLPPLLLPDFGPHVEIKGKVHFCTTAAPRRGSTCPALTVFFTPAQVLNWFGLLFGLQSAVFLGVIWYIGISLTEQVCSRRGGTRTANSTASASGGRGRTSPSAAARRRSSGRTTCRRRGRRALRLQPRLVV